MIVGRFWEMLTDAHPGKTKGIRFEVIGNSPTGVELQVSIIDIDDPQGPMLWPKWNVLLCPPQAVGGGMTWTVINLDAATEIEP